MLSYVRDDDDGLTIIWNNADVQNISIINFIIILIFIRGDDNDDGDVGSEDDDDGGDGKDDDDDDGGVNRTIHLVIPCWPESVGHCGRS